MVIDTFIAIFVGIVGAFACYFNFLRPGKKSEFFEFIVTPSGRKLPPFEVEHATFDSFTGELLMSVRRQGCGPVPGEDKFNVKRSNYVEPWMRDLVTLQSFLNWSSSQEEAERMFDEFTIRFIR